MAITNQSLDAIKTSLQNISSGLSSMSAAEKAKFDNSSSAKALSGGLTQLGGTLTSEQARRTVENTKKESTPSTSGGSLSEAYSKLFQENAKTREELAKAQADLTSARSGLSIADQQKKQVEDEAAAALLKGKKNNKTTPDVNTETSADPMVELAGDDPVLKAMLDSQYQQADSITSQLDVLNRQMLDADDDTKFMIRQIENLANQQITRQEKANEQMVRGAKVAGLVAGVAQYSPETHSGIVQQTINDGLALIQDIEFKAMEKKYQAKKDLRDFNYKSYLESQKLVTEYNDLKNKTIISMYEQIQKAETDAREQIRFDNEQADRLASILAEELIGASDAKIKETADANGISFGSLLGAVRDITPAASSTKRSTQVITLNGKQVLVDTQTGEVISEFGNESVDFDTYLQIAQDEMKQSIDPNSQLYKDLKSDWESTYSGKKTNTVVSLYGDKIQSLVNPTDGKIKGITPEAAVRKITEDDKTKLTREEEQALLDYAKSL